MHVNFQSSVAQQQPAKACAALKIYLFLCPAEAHVTRGAQLDHLLLCVHAHCEFALCNACLPHQALLQSSSQETIWVQYALTNALYANVLVIIISILHKLELP